MENSLLNMTLEEIENDYWHEEVFPTALVEKCHLARKKKLKDLEAGDVRLLIGQNISLPYLVPLAAKWLENDILTDATFYPGDLLVSVLRVPGAFWKENLALWNMYNDLYRNFRQHIMQSVGMTNEIRRYILDGYQIFSEACEPS